jgi:hypothetical protein
MKILTIQEACIRINNNPNISRYTQFFCQQHGLGINILPIQLHPQYSLLTDSIGSSTKEGNTINVFLNLDIISAERQKRRFVNILEHTFCHELLHVVLDIEGFPTIDNRRQYESWDRVHRILGSVQNAVNHIEVNRRQTVAALPYVVSANLANVLWDKLNERNIDLCLDFKQKEQIYATFNGISTITAAQAEDMMRNICSIIHMENTMLIKHNS